MISADKAKEITRQANNEDQKLNKMQGLAFQLVQTPEFLKACEESILKIIDEEVNKSAHDGLSECTVSTCLEFVSGIGTGHFLKNPVALSDLHIANLFKKLLPVLTHNEGNPHGIPYYYALSADHFDGTGHPQLNRCYQFQISGELLEAINKELGKTIRTDLRIAGYKLNSITLKGNRKHHTPHEVFICYYCGYTADRDVKVSPTLMRYNAESMKNICQLQKQGQDYQILG